MDTPPKTRRHQIGALVVRAERPRVGFSWELREYGKGEPLEAGDVLYPTEADARVAGEAALTRFKAADR